MFTPGWEGIVHRVDLLDDTTGTNVNFISGINDCSGVFFSNFEGQNALYVNESQFGVAFGVNFVPTSNPFCVKVFEVSNLTTSTSNTVESPSFLSVYPNPSTGDIHLSSKDGKIIKKVKLYSLDGKLIKRYALNGTEKILRTDLTQGTYFLKGFLQEKEPFSVIISVDR